MSSLHAEQVPIVFYWQNNMFQTLTRRGNTDGAINKTQQLLAAKAAFFPSTMSRALIKKLKWCR